MWAGLPPRKYCFDIVIFFFRVPIASENSVTNEKDQNVRLLLPFNRYFEIKKISIESFWLVFYRVKISIVLRFFWQSNEKLHNQSIIFSDP